MGNSEQHAGLGNDDLLGLLYSIDEKEENLPGNKTYGEWTSRWWQWAFTSPREVIQTDYGTDKKNYGIMQDIPVWFLAGTSGGNAERTYKIAAGAPILFPIINMECSIAGEGYQTESELRTCAKSYIDQTTEIEVTINNFKLGDFKKGDFKRYRLQSPIFDLAIPENNFLGLQEANTQAVSDGYWIFLKHLPPLPQGKSEHKIYFLARDLIFKIEVTFTIIPI